MQASLWAALQREVSHHAPPGWTAPQTALPAAPAGTCPPGCLPAGWRRVPAPRGAGVPGWRPRPSGRPAHPGWQQGGRVACRRNRGPALSSSGGGGGGFTACCRRTRAAAVHACNCRRAALRPGPALGGLAGTSGVLFCCYCGPHRQLIPRQVHGAQPGEAGKEVAREGAPHVPACSSRAAPVLTLAQQQSSSQFAVRRRGRGLGAARDPRERAAPCIQLREGGPRAQHACCAAPAVLPPAVLPHAPRAFSCVRWPAEHTPPIWQRSPSTTVWLASLSAGCIQKAGAAGG